MLQRFFIICSGADTNILANCSKAEQTKYAGIGATVFFTALMAFIAASYALYTVFDSVYLSIGFGIVWGLLIFNLDRYIVATLKKRTSFTAELLQALPRIVLAVIIAVVIAKPLELKIFEKEINQVLLTQKNELTLQNKNQIAKQYAPRISAQQLYIKDLQKNLGEKEQEVNQLYTIYIAEAEGREGTKLLGKGPVYKEKREKHDAALAELQTLKKQTHDKIEKAEQEIEQLIVAQKENEAVTQPIINNFDGLMARVNALGKLPWIPSFFIFLLFLAIETAPILVKLLASKSEYDFKLEEQESAVTTWIKQKIAEREQQIVANTTISKKVHTAIQNEEEVFAYKKQKAIELYKWQANTFYTEQQKVSG